MQPERTFLVDKMPVRVYRSGDDLGRAAAADLAAILRAALSERDQAAIIVATGNSQLSFMNGLRAAPGIDWGRVTVFHMDEYLGLPAQHPASFRRYIREKLTDVVLPRAFYGIEGDAPNTPAEIARYTALLRAHTPVACVLGIGENGHLAFNDPPADLETDSDMHVVTLAESARLQQVGEGHFPDLEHVPPQAITLTIPALLRPPHVLAVVPEARKAAAVRRALLGPVSGLCPASVLRTHSHVILYLDHESAAEIGEVR